MGEGAVSRLGVVQAGTNVGQTEATIPQLETQLRQAQNRLCVLMGIPPQDLSALLDGEVPIPQAPARVAVGVPADLLRRRPDVRRAERLAAAQSARVGIAETSLYPAFSITGSIFVQATELNNLFTPGAVAGNVGPSFNWNILNYGRIVNTIDAEEAVFMQRVTEYQDTVLNANREAEDAIVAYLRAQEQARILREGVAAAVESRDLINALYQGGRADFGRVFVAEFFLVQQQDLLAQAEGSIAGNLVEIYRALGGGWQIRLQQPGSVPVLPQPLPPVEEIDVPEGAVERAPMPPQPPRENE
jgi:outer membrane protein TolC